MKIDDIPDPIYQRKIVLVHSCTVKELRERYPKEKFEDGFNGCYYGPNEDDGSAHTLMIGGRRPSVGRTAVLGHELLHLVFRVMRDAGIKSVPESEEAFTHYFQHLITECLRRMNARPKRGKR